MSKPPNGLKIDGADVATCSTECVRAPCKVMFGLLKTRMLESVLFDKVFFDRTSVVAVVVTMDRPRELDRLLAKLSSQDYSHRIVVVDNGGLEETARIVGLYPNATLLRSKRNLGGAGGFSYGIMHALALGGDLIWLMDDDGYPETSACLSQLEQAIRVERYAMVAPVILNIDDPSQLAFYYYHDGRPVKRRDKLEHLDSFRQFAHLFNGALVRAEAFERYGLPRYELFFRGDEVDFMFRLNRDGARFATLTNVGFLHPSGKPDTVPIMGGRYHAIFPRSAFARYYYHRNRGNLFREFRLVKACVLDLVRYSWFFLVTRKGDVAGLREWARAAWRGWTRNFVPFVSAEPKTMPSTPSDEEARRAGSAGSSDGCRARSA